jgi:hypothetical protein
VPLGISERDIFSSFSANLEGFWYDPIRDGIASGVRVDNSLLSSHLPILFRICMTKSNAKNNHFLNLSVMPLRQLLIQSCAKGK